MSVLIESVFAEMIIDFTFASVTGLFKSTGMATAFPF
jgi:hypothetical protein